MIRIYGASDDLVEFEGDVTGEVGCYGVPVLIRVGSDEAGLRIVASYAAYAEEFGSDAPGWAFGVATVNGNGSGDDDEGKIPWPVRIERERYSTAIVIDCPPGTPVAYRLDSGDWKVPS